MSKLKNVQGNILFSSNDMLVVTLTEHEDGKEELIVVLPEGVRLVVLPADSGLKLDVIKTVGDPCVSIYARRFAPKPVLSEEKS